MPQAPPTASFALPRLAALLAACALCVGLFFRGQIADGFTLLNGDRHDGVIALSIMEHWANVLRGRAAWDTTHYFHPVPATLGYNDGYLAFGLLFAGFRALGADPFLAGELVNMALRAIGFLGFHLAARRVLGLSFGWALLGAALFTLSNNLAIRASNVQLFSVSLVPLLAVLAHGALTALLRGRQGVLLLWGAGFLAWHALMLMTGYYMAWYAAFLGAALLLAWLAVAGAERRRRLLAALRGALPALGALGALALLLNLPFLRLYLPKARETGMHDYAGMVAQYTLSPLDLIHVGERNLLWGWLVRALNAAFRPDMPFWSEQMTGLPPLLLLAFAAALAWLWRGGAAEDDRTAFLRALAIATLATWALALRIGGASPWWLVYEFVPGARAARVVARYQVFLVVPVIALALAFLAARARRWPGPALGLLAALLVAEQLNAYAPRFLDRPLELARLRSVPPAPAECRAFFVTAARTESRFGEEVDNIYNHNTEAMLIAEVLGLPTINGISTFNPPLWPESFPPRPEYFAAVRRYAAAHGLDGLCGLDLQRWRWEVAPS
ncbi:hypothetical protein [Crenalkalicoccus roseus]|uniref:hypothetical protein n=1 Tax=Crenalkalicoccus roseus TaxID=1485588 RepID=UPI0010811CF3|nr:hypothetical protein [Crenalkalicoccus roseus]